MLYESSKKFQDAWTTHLPWEKFVINEKGLVQQVRCKICKIVRGKEKLLAPKLDSLLKHVEHWKAKFLMPSVDADSHYFNKIWCMLKMNTIFLLAINLLSWISSMLMSLLSIKRSMYNATYFHLNHLLTHGCLVINYENMPSLFHMLKVKFVSCKHWSSSLSWGMAKMMHDVLLEATKVAFVHANFIVVSADEIITIDNKQWLSIHLYMVQCWKKIAILLCVESMGVSTTSNNIFGLIVKDLLKFGGLRLEELARKLVSMGCNGSSIFQGH